MKKTAVLLVDDHTVVRQGLRALLTSEVDIEVAGEADDGRKALLLAKDLRPEVVIMDLAMPLLNGYEGMRQILKAVPSARVLVLSSYMEKDSVQRALKAGAAGYVLKQTASHELCRAIREVRRGRSFFSPEVAKFQEMENELPGADGESATRNGELSSREAEVLQLIAEGFSNKQVAVELNISVKTVEKHRQAVRDKLDLYDTASLTRYAISAGFVERRSPALR